MPTLQLLPASDNDIELVMAWRSHPDVYAGFYTQTAPLTWEEHNAWWHSRPSSWREFIIWLDGRRIGVVSIGQTEHWSPELGYLLGEVSLWGKGYGKQAVQLALDWLRGEGKGYCHTTVLKDNTRSLQLLEGLGFKVLGDAREGEVWLTKKL